MGKKTVVKDSRVTYTAVNRDVGLQSKGPRLQRLRAALLLLRHIDEYPEKVCFCAVEFQGDVLLVEASVDGTSEYHEENKNYDSSTAFTMNSPEVLNSLVSFIDCWLSKQMSPSVKFGFYTPNAYTKEKHSPNNKKLSIEWPDDSVLGKLVSGDTLEDSIVDLISKCVIEEYKAQAAKHVKNGKPSAGAALSSLDVIERWQRTDWKTFLSNVEWKFGQDDCTTIYDDLIEAIQSSCHYSERLAGKERQIIAALVERIDDRQVFEDPSQRLVGTSEAVLVFEQTAAGTLRLPDPAWKLWQTLQPSDTRSLTEKVSAVYPEVSQRELAIWNRKAAHSLVEQEEFSDNRSVLALKFQIFEACDEKLAELIPVKPSKPLSQCELNDVIQSLTEVAESRYDDCTSQYHYPIKSKSSIKSLVFELFQGCFLNFDCGGVT